MRLGPCPPRRQPNPSVKVPITPSHPCGGEQLQLYRPGWYHSDVNVRWTLFTHDLAGATGALAFVVPEDKTESGPVRDKHRVSDLGPPVCHIVRHELNAQVAAPRSASTRRTDPGLKVVEQHEQSRTGQEDRQQRQDDAPNTRHGAPEVVRRRPTFPFRPPRGAVAGLTAVPMPGPCAAELIRTRGGTDRDREQEPAAVEQRRHPVGHAFGSGAAVDGGNEQRPAG